MVLYAAVSDRIDNWATDTVGVLSRLNYFIDINQLYT